MLCWQSRRPGWAKRWPIRSVGENFTLTAAVPGPDGWEVGAYGIRTPVLERAALIRPEALDLVLVPCTAFDAVCRRVGMGKGYYDRYLPGAGTPWRWAWPLRPSGCRKRLQMNRTGGWMDL